MKIQIFSERYSMVNLMEFCWHFVLLSMVSCILVIEAQNVKESCVDVTSTKKSAEFDCGADGKISDVEVRSGTGSCQILENERCYGLTPQLLVARLNCFWQRRCVIDWPRELILLPEDDGQCAGQTPSFLQLRYKCFHPDVVVDTNIPYNIKTKPSKYLIEICNNLNRGRSEYELTGRSQLAGIIRSHSTYPWDYHSMPRSCAVHLFWPADQKLVVSIQSLELGESDSLQIGGDVANETTVGERLEFPGIGRQFNTIFNFTVGLDSNGGRGFVVCFKFTNQEDKSERNACEEITSRGNIDHFPLDSPRVDFQSLLQKLEEEEHVNENVTPARVINKKCEKKKTEKKKKRCYDRLNKKRGGKKKQRKKRNKKSKTEKAKKE